MQRKIFSLFSFITVLFFQNINVQAQDVTPQVLASIHPLALVAASIVPTEQIDVLVPKGMSPHDFSLRPSDIDRIQNADLVIWAGATAEPYLKGFVKRWPDKKWLDVSQFQEKNGIKDPHWWLSPSMMIQAQEQLAEQLQLPAGDFAEQVNSTVAQAQIELEPLQERGFWVFHSAYEHFVALMNLNQLGAFTISPEQKPGARTLQKIRKQLASGDVVCVFSEPEYSPALVDTVLKGQSAKRGELDPMAIDIPLQADGYVLFIKDMSQRFQECLKD